MTKITKTVMNMLDIEEEIKYDVIDRFFLRNLLDEEDYKSTVEDLAFTLEDELRSQARFFLMDCTMWKEIVMPYVEEADYREIADKWLSRKKQLKLEQIKEESNA